MIVRHTMFCDGCNIVIAPGARSGEDYDQCLGSHWHKKQSCIEKMIEKLKREKPEFLPPAA